MSLAPGARIGPYEVVAPLGAGGMGEVYRARDARLNRDVAIKILPELFAQDPERLARFEREAKALAALNHPNIAAIYGLEGNALVMELVEGEDLSKIIRSSEAGPSGPADSPGLKTRPPSGKPAGLPLEDALPIARQIAEALEAAHEQGIVHRDLKPGNVKVRADGTVKVLDFGLAKALDPSGAIAASNASNSPTLTARATQMGMIIGTAAYMSPEQAKGKAVDRRADIWAFGVVLYEMLTGRRAFEGEDISTTLAAVLMKEPEWTALPTTTPPALVTLIHRCLERDPKQRLRDIGEARLLLSNPQSMSGRPAEASAPLTPSSKSSAAWGVAGIALIAAAVFGALWVSGFSKPGAVTRVEALIAPPPGWTIGAGFALSPDGQRLVMTAVNQETGASSLWLRYLASGTPTALPQTDGGSLPFWSPDGMHVAFFADGKLKTTDLQGSPPQVVCEAPSPRGGAWGSGKRIVLSGTLRTGLEIVDAGGGTPKALTTFDETRGEKSHRWPVFLDDDHLLFVAQTGEAGAKDDSSTIEALTISTGVRTKLVTANSSPIYSAQGFLLFWREGALRAQAFDARKLAVSGTVFPVASGLEFDLNELVYASVSPDGTLVYLPDVGTSRATIMVADRKGIATKTIVESVMDEGGLSLSHDGTRLAVSITASGARSQDIWTYDLIRGTSRPLTFEEGSDLLQVWSPNDTQIIYANDRLNDGAVFRRSSDGRGQPELIGKNAAGIFPFAWSHDGDWLVVNVVTGTTGLDVLRFDIKTQKLTPLAQGPSNESAGALSPKDQWLAYTSDLTGRQEVWVNSVADGSRWRVSTQGGSMPSWRKDGRELYFIGLQNQLMTVDVEPGAPFRHSTPRELFKAVFNWISPDDLRLPYAPMPDGQHFVLSVLKERRSQLLTLVTNWTKGASK
jgi:serine/threonine protein kinase/Tol biopolymer transport system component